ncbi:hypothetical protein AB1K70_22310 [Bremerella sp. JC770]|uniref:hypothetical protein n=1 Tax=Bremerella sp. JC770 TaxID=3232137 RepID=UPI00345B18A6
MSVITECWLINDECLTNFDKVLIELPALLGLGAGSEIYAATGDEGDSEFIAEGIEFSPTEGILPYFQAGSILTVFDDFAGITGTVERIIEKELPAETKGDILLDRFFLTVGLRQLQIEEAPDVFLEHTLGLCFWGYSTPPDCPEFELRLCNSVLFQQMKTELEKLCGPLRAVMRFG